MSDQGPDRRPTAEPTSPGELIDVIKEYAKQETLGPLRGAGRWLAFGALGAFLIGVGLVLVLLGLLRLIQTEWPETFDGAWSWVPYVIVLVVCSAAVAFALSRVKQSTLGKEPS
jgi:hypothetical protein